jgi:hypothetical protein
VRGAAWLAAVAMTGVAACARHPESGPAAAGRHLVVGSVARGRLTSADPRVPGTQRASHTWTLEALAGQRLIIDMTGASSSLDPHLILQDSAGRELARDDDGGAGRNARLRFLVRRAGRYRVIANNYLASRYGAYALSVSEMWAPATNLTGVRGTLARGETRDAVLARGDAVETRITGLSMTMDRSGRLTRSSVTTQTVEYHAWLFPAAAGDSVTFELHSNRLDPLLILQDADGHELERHSGNRAAASIALRFPVAGTFRIVATTGAAPRYGAYTLSIR